jgi:hypothetical protein
MKRLASILACAMILATTTSLADAAGSPRSARTDTAVCPAFGSVTYYETFRGGEFARAAIVGDGGTDLDIFVYDMNGRLVVRGIGPTDVEAVSWVPCYTQQYRIVVRNLGCVWNRYSIAVR